MWPKQSAALAFSWAEVTCGGRGEQKSEVKRKSGEESHCVLPRDSHRDAEFGGNRSGAVDTCHSTGVQCQRQDKNGLRTSKRTS